MDTTRRVSRRGGTSAWRPTPEPARPPQAASHPPTGSQDYPTPPATPTNAYSASGCAEGVRLAGIAFTTIGRNWKPGEPCERGCSASSRTTPPRPDTVCGCFRITRHSQHAQRPRSTSRPATATSVIAPKCCFTKGRWTWWIRSSSRWRRNCWFPSPSMWTRHRAAGRTSIAPCPR